MTSTDRVGPHKRHGLWLAIRQLFGDVRDTLISGGIAGVMWLAADRLDRTPSAVTVGWVFFCLTGILFHWSNLTEVYADRRAVVSHPSSNDIDEHSLGDAIRGEWLRIATKTLFLFAGAVALFRVEGFGPFVIACLMIGVFCLDIDAALDRISRRRLMALIVAEIDDRPLGLTTEERLDRAIDTARTMFHDMNGEVSMILPVLASIQQTGRPPEGVDIGPIVDRIEELSADLKEAHSLIRSFAPEPHAA